MRLELFGTGHVDFRSCQHPRTPRIAGGYSAAEVRQDLGPFFSNPAQTASPLALTTTWIAAVSSLFTNSAVRLVKYGLTKPAGILSLMTGLYGCVFSRCLRSVC